MKKLFRVFFFLTAVVLIGCVQKKEITAEERPKNIPSSTDFPSQTVTVSQVPGMESLSPGLPADGTKEFDVDLTCLSSTMIYAEVYRMMCAPEEYVGKRIRMSGAFSVYQDEETRMNYFSCVIMDATACCAQGIEFVLKGEPAYPEAYPVENADITVSGIFETYMEGESMYCRLRDAELE